LESGLLTRCFLRNGPVNITPGAAKKGGPKAADLIL